MTQRNHRPGFGGLARLLGWRKGAALVALLALSLFTIFASTVVAAPITIVDDKGPDDLPGQKDLSFLTVDYSPPTPGTVNVTWGWDDTAWSGGNTGDACALVDTDADGFANFSLCVTVGGNPATFQSVRLYSCG